ncbi:trehalose-phosphate synthase [Intrasporangium oryzae NRRL B-24470]|uniref:Trehalose-phosphate synthase n=1 Tax=Intrasporangium oryzae NRRL B-24470 TaxID=1386089 RepID=W9G173_9MICO|nr:trehalose-6-phosphate synthase [Intrasporangium oryzae]EWS99845.1 trehalose-phosphate synthase [Intrasporangium oryzae NRRL B-24470]
MPSARPTFDLVVAANRLPVDKVVTETGETEWRRSPGGLVTAMESVMRAQPGAWVGWAGDAGDAPEPFEEDGIHLEPVPLSAAEVRDFYEGFSNDTLWPIYHDVIVPARFHRDWWASYQTVNRRFAEAVAEVAAPGATVWVQDYQLQLVPALVRELRPDVRIGWFDHIPFPPVELFAQLPWRAQLLEGLLGADFLGFQRQADARNFVRACRQLLGAATKGDRVAVDHERQVRAAAIPISVDFRGLEALAKRPDVRARAKEIRASLGDPKVLMLGVDRLDYTKGIRHRLKAYEELLLEGRISPPDVTFVQVATPSRERVEAYRLLRTEIEQTVGRINGDLGHIGAPAVHYLHHSYPREEMAALFQAADVMLVTPLRDGMNLVAKEYVTCRYDLGGALVLSEFTGAWHELHQSFACNPHDIEGLKQAILRAMNTPAKDKQRIMRALRRRVSDNDVQRWASRYLAALAAAPERPAPDRYAARRTQAELAPADPQDPDLSGDDLPALDGQDGPDDLPAPDGPDGDGMAQRRTGAGAGHE